MTEYHWFPLRVRTPYVLKIIEEKEGLLVFNGYFYLEDETMPVRRLLYRESQKKMYLVDILSKKTMDDTSEYGDYDKELGGSACFFPTNIIKLEYKILREEDHDFEKLCDEIDTEEAAVLERDKVYEEKRRDAMMKRFAEGTNK